MTTHLSSAVAEDQSLLICQMYPGVYTQVMSDRAPAAAAVKPALRRRRRKRKGEGGAKKRNLSVEQVRQLELSFEHQHKLETERKDRLAAEVGLDPRQVAVWFQNRRARWKAKRMEEEYSKLKAVLDTQAIENRRLEAEVTKLKQQLSEAERRLSEQSAVDAGVPCKSCLSAASLSIQSMEAHLLGGLRMDGLESIFYAPPAPAESYYVQDMDWADLQGV